ncbi:hypothetical protein EJB05_13283, partial [Eragrostis curvula]
MAAPYSSILLIIVLLSVVVPSTLAARSAAGGDSTHLQNACSKTEFPGLCVDALSPIPESRAASPRRLAELAFGYLTARGPALQAEARRVTAATKDASMLRCLREFDENIDRYVVVFGGLSPEKRDADFAEAERRLMGVLDYPSNSGIGCSEDQMRMPVPVGIKNYEAMLQVTLDLMMKAVHASKKNEGKPARLLSSSAVCHVTRNENV